MPKQDGVMISLFYVANIVVRSESGCVVSFESVKSSKMVETPSSPMTPARKNVHVMVSVPPADTVGARGLCKEERDNSPSRLIEVTSREEEETKAPQLQEEQAPILQGDANKPPTAGCGDSFRVCAFCLKPIRICASVYSKYNLSLPKTTAFVTCYVKGAVADWTTQRYGGNNVTAFDYARCNAFALHSGLYLGVFQCFLYTHLFTKCFGEFPESAFRTRRAFLSLLKKCSFESLVHAPFLYMPNYFAFEYLMLHGGDWREGLRVYFQTEEGWRALRTNWSMWPFFNFFIFAFVPVHLRVAVMALFSYVWLCVLSFVSFDY